jgi:hypothetical protein
VGSDLDDEHQRDRAAAELEAVRPYLDLARAIRDEVERFTSDDAALVESFVLALDALPRRERDRVALEVFDRLPVEAQWSVLERVFDDEDLRAALGGRREALLRTADRRAGLVEVVAVARTEGRLDLRTLAPDEPLVIGLFRPVDTAAAIGRGRDSAVCARRLDLRSTDEPGRFRVIDDRFNPRGGLFVGADYDEAAWRAERCAGHSLVRLGSITEDGNGAHLEPVVYAGARVDMESGGVLHTGRLHLGYAVLGGLEVFAGPP